MSYLFNRNSVLSDFCAKSFIATKPIYPLHHVIEIPLFAILFDLLCVYCLFPTCRSSSRERAGGELPRHRLRRPRAAATRIRRQVSLMHVVPIFCTYLYDCMLVFMSELWEYLRVISFHVLSLLPGIWVEY
jgi:hypothetical protein